MSSWLCTSKQRITEVRSDCGHSNPSIRENGIGPARAQPCYIYSVRWPVLHFVPRDNDNTWIQISTVMYYSSSTDHHWLDTWRLWIGSKKSLKVCLGPFLCPGSHFTGFLAVPCTLSAQSLSQLFLFPSQVFTQATQRLESLTTCTVAPILSCYSSPV